MCSVNSVLNSISVLLFLRKEANILVLVGKKPAEWRLNKDGKSFFEAKSPVAPKMTMDKPSWRTWRRDGSGIRKRYFSNDDEFVVLFSFVC